jgi:hypothetical protein
VWNDATERSWNEPTLLSLLCKCKDGKGQEGQVTEQLYNIDMNYIVKHIEELIKQYQADEKAAWKPTMGMTEEDRYRSEGRAGTLEDVVSDLKKIVQKVTSK